jgi:hypothetical protein
MYVYKIKKEREPKLEQIKKIFFVRKKEALQREKMSRSL